MARKSDSELKPRNGHTLIVGIVCRISGCANQKELSLEDQEDNAREAIKDLYDGPVEFRVIATIGKGERLDRPELEQIEAAYHSGEYDVFVYDDLSRLIRGGEAARLLGVGVDHGTRSICVDDGIDTIDETWEEDALNACSENVAHNQRTSKRIKQKSMNRFKKYGSTGKRSIYGYDVPEGAKSYDDWLKNPAAEPNILEGARILRETLNGEAVADYFNRNDVPVGPYSRSRRWDGTMVLRFYRNPLLKGMPQRGRMATVKQHATGQRVSKKNPKGPTYYEAPHLAFFERAEFDDLVAKLAEHNAHYRRKRVNGVDPRANVSRKRTRFPGQHARCGYCGRAYNWGGNGITGHLMCAGSHKWHCWNSIHIDGAIVVERVMQAITESLYRLEGFDEQFRQLVNEACHSRSDSSDVHVQQLAQAEQQLLREKENLLAAITAFGPKPMFAEKLSELEGREQELARKRYLLQKSASKPLVLPQSVAELRELLEAQFQPLNIESVEFGMLLRKIVPEFQVHLVRLLDGGYPMSRARVKLSLGAMLADIAQVPTLENLLTRELTIDLFDPPQRERIRREVVRLSTDPPEGKKLTQRQIGAQLAENPRQSAVQAALALHGKMLSLGLDTPYQVLREPPVDYPKLRRHKNRKYHFEPLEGFLPLQF